jgi:acyl-CoA synthetase (AMP-forming)/AMP-acid ligase II
MPNGPEMATAFLSIASVASAAPLNPAYRAAEFEFYLEDLGAGTLVVPEGSSTPAVAVASRLGIDVVRVRPRADGPAGIFDLLNTTSGGEMASTARPAPDDEALVLHTSGTTSRPKLVPLLQRNLAASAIHIRETLALRPGDRSLSMMPLFHIHGLMACLLAPLAAGGSVFCTEGFDALKFYGWLGEGRPTWYSAVPTMHQAILARASHNAGRIAASGLRFIRSSSAPLPPSVMARLEETFGVPAVEAYAMTEAAHQMTSNQLPPGLRKPGTVGPSAGPEVGIMDAAGSLLGPDEVGEIVVRGPNVMAGYEAEAESGVNDASFTHGWFRTGDEGRLDADGFLTITGRLKEIINRGGEKVSPLEVDRVLGDHPAVRQVVTFAVAHDLLGEDVAAAVVLEEGTQADQDELRRYAAGRLARFKVPARIVFVAEIPKGPTGKLRRIGLAELLGVG